MASINSANIDKIEGFIYVQKRNQNEYTIGYDNPKLRYKYIMVVTEQELNSFATQILEMTKQEAQK